MTRLELIIGPAGEIRGETRGFMQILADADTHHHVATQLVRAWSGTFELTDGHGRTVSFRNTVVLMTSNIGSQFIQGAADLDDPEVKRSIDAAMRAAFKPEFLNRIDDIIVFHRLGREHLGQIVRIQLGRLTKLLGDQKLNLELSESAIDLLCQEGYDPAYGARPLKRVIQRLVQDPLAKAILAGQFKPGDTVYVDRDGDRLIIGALAFAQANKAN